MIGQRLKRARTAAGLSLRALAAQVGLSAMAISKYETGKAMPSSPVLLALAKALGVSLEYFLRPKSVELEEIDYRKHSNLPKKILGQIEGDVLEQVERFLDLKDYLPGAPIFEFKLPKGLPGRIAEYDEIEDVAELVRKGWGLGTNPIPELTDTLEERGIMVFQSKALHDSAFDGLAARVDGIPVVVVGTGWPGDRQRFTLAHELGHLALKGRLTRKIDEEKAANRFAGAFLVPKPEVLKELGPTRTWLEPNELCVLKKTYGLSMGGWMHRAKDLGILSDTRYVAMVRFFGSRGWRKTEPCDEYPREEPKLFEQLVFRALAEDLISESKAAELLRKSLPEFHQLRNLERAGTADQ